MFGRSMAIISMEISSPVLSIVDNSAAFRRVEASRVKLQLTTP